jgi:polyisoprenoid-binding protein YceI
MTISTHTNVLDDVTGVYQLDLVHTRVGFSARHVLVARVHGWFDTVDGRLHLDAAQPTSSSAELTIDAASIRTNNTDRDAHLRSPDFFDVERYPTITYNSTRITVLGDDRYRVEGDLAIKGVARPVRLDLTHQGSCVDPYGQYRTGFSGFGAIKRSEWGLTWNQTLDTGGVVVSDRIELEIDVSAIKVG